MRIQYHELFRIHCRHDYFADKTCRVLTLVPTERCQQLLDRYRCRFRPMPGGGAVYYGVTDDDDPAGALKHFDEDVPFGFTLTSSDPNLETYTELASPEGGGATGETPRYFDNRHANPVEIDGSQCLLLHPPGTSVTPPADFPVDVPRGAPPWGSIEIFPGSDDAEQYRLLGKDGAIAPKIFTIALAARQTIWRYYVIAAKNGAAKNGAGLDKYRITGAPVNGARGASTKPIAFSGPTEAMIGGRAARVFESQTPIPLCERPGAQHVFTLAAGDAGDDRKLPFAQIAGTRLEKTASAAPRMCSEIYVYL